MKKEKRIITIGDIIEDFTAYLMIIAIATFFLLGALSAQIDYESQFQNNAMASVSEKLHEISNVVLDSTVMQFWDIGYKYPLVCLIIFYFLVVLFLVLFIVKIIKYSKQFKNNKKEVKNVRMEKNRS